MESCGPDLIWWGNNRFGDPVKGADGSGRGISFESFFYDPSNGTISAGQLLYFDGAVAFPES